MRFRERVAIHAATRTRSARGGVVDTFAVVPGLNSVAATISSRGSGYGMSGSRRNDGTDLTVIEDLLSVILAGDHPEVTAAMRVVAARGTFDVISVEQTLGHNQTVLTVRATDPAGTPR